MALRKSIANRYAKALVDVAMEAKIHDRVLVELEDFKNLLSSQRELQEVLETPALPTHVRGRVLKELLDRTRVDRTTRNFLLLLLERNRLKYLPEVSQAFVDIVDQRMGVLSAEVISAADLPLRNREALRARLAERTGKKVKLNYSIDGSLIGGVVLRIGSTVYDGSIRTQLQEMKKRIARE